ncbi:MAG TPA: hypothetical protein VIN08_28280 [Ohtaekwangia sp.]|uniref:hypothetical protein n=1 Tax=Ohtaekwangia sp. TaxID=2066019 RepID=UPI002F934788
MLVLYTTILIAQPSDSSSSKPFQHYWTKQRFVPKIGVGMQDRAFVEVGLYWQNIYKHPLSLASKGPYTTVDIFVDDSNLLLGPKLGYEFTAGIFGVAADVTYFIDHNYNSEGANRQSLVFTPKVGLTILGFADIFYGYQVPISNTEITSLYRNRFSLVFNLNRDYFNLKEAPRK